MASTAFVLKEPTSKEKTLLYMLFHFNNKRLKFSTSEKIFPKFWNSEKQRAKETKQFLVCWVLVLPYKISPNT
jgi:hypothetical protein